MDLSKIPLSPAQKDIFVDQLLHVDSPHYNIGLYISIKGLIDENLFSNAINSSLRSNDTFRLRIDLREQGLCCYISDDPRLYEVSRIDFTTSAFPIEEAKQWMQ